MGRSFTNKYGETCWVEEVVSAKEVKVRFDNGYISSYQKNSLEIGVFKTPYSKSVANVGYIGEGKYAHSRMTLDDNYLLWHNMLCRCYCDSRLKSAPHYNNTVVCEEWYNFQEFSKWFFSVDERLNFDEKGRKFVLDKDLLGDKTYSPETCCFVPAEINSFLTGRKSCRGNLMKGVSMQSGRYKSMCQGVGFLGYFDTELEAFNAYKEAKENRAKELAEKWRGQIITRAYKALMKYKVEVTD